MTYICNKWRLLLLVTALLISHPARSQEWRGGVRDGTVIWGEGWGASVEEADRAALSSLASRISVAVTSGYRQVEQQVTSSRGDEYSLVRSHRSSSFSSVTLPDTRREVLRDGRKAHVVRWIRRDELERLFADRKARILEYERRALEAEREAGLDDALRCHYWAYVLLRSLQRPSELLSDDGRMLLNAIPENIAALLDDLKVRHLSRVGNTVRLGFTFRGRPVEGLDFRYFDGARWSGITSVSAGQATLEMAPGALAEYIQLKVEYAYEGDSQMDGELSDAMSVLDLKPIRKSFITFRAGN